jgi:hypothetical protein
MVALLADDANLVMPRFRPGSRAATRSLAIIASNIDTPGVRWIKTQANG